MMSDTVIVPAKKDSNGYHVKRIVKYYLGFVVVVFILVVIFAVISLSFRVGSNLSKNQITTSKTLVKKFASEEDFKIYLKNGSESTSYGMGFGGVGMATRTLDLAAPQAAVGAPAQSNFAAPQEKSVPERVSTTNVQVVGIDEPDIVKTDGKNIYLSTKDFYYPVIPMVKRTVDLNIAQPGVEIMPPYRQPSTDTKIIKAFPPQDLSQSGSIKKSGDLLLDNNILIVFENNKLYGYDISDPKNPKDKWDVNFDQNNIVTSRLYKGKIYVVISSYINNSRPCPLSPVISGKTTISIACSDIYHPVTTVPVNTTYTAMIINPTSGNIENKVSFVGSLDSSILYMSNDSMYVTYAYNEDYTEFMYKFLSSEGSKIVPADITARINKLNTYDISSRAKMVELQSLLDDFYNSLSSDQRLKVENEMTNKMESYFKNHKRELEKTGIVKITLSDFRIASSGEVPGHTLNQYSLDEYNGNLRIATTIQGSMVGSSESVSDVYVLDGSLNKLGSVLNLGEKERIYSVRFIDNRGYVVTFRQTDPFYVLDLSIPSSPKLAGELKIPGYSSYLHPLTVNRILGVGKEGSNVKLSMFDVKDAANPREISKYNLDEYSTEVLNNPRAFLLDNTHNVFFLPGEKGGYVFSYSNDEFNLEVAKSGIQVKRAIYLDNYMYIIANDKITVLDENTWKDVKVFAIEPENSLQ